MSSRAPRLSAIFAAAASPSPRAPNLALVAATERVRSGAFGAEDARHLLDELLRYGTPVPGRPLNGFLAALARAPSSSACSDGPALAVSFFCRMSRAAGPRVMSLSSHTYGILMECCTRAQRPELAMAFFGRLLRTGLGVDVITFSSLLKGLCEAKRTNEALDVVLHRMHELGCVPNVVSYSILLKSFFKEGQVAKACDLFNKMIQQGIPPDLVTYSSIIDALCKVRAMDKAEAVLSQMADKGVHPNSWTYNSLIYGYSSSGQWKDVVRVFKDMTYRGLVPDIVTWSSLMASLCKHGKYKDARDIFDMMVLKGQKPNIITYQIMLDAYATEGCVVDMTDLFDLMLRDGVAPDHKIFSVLVKGYAKCGMVDRAMIIFNEMRQHGVKPDVSTMCLLKSIVDLPTVPEDGGEDFPEEEAVSAEFVLLNSTKEGKLLKWTAAAKVDLPLHTKIVLSNDFGRTYQFWPWLACLRTSVSKGYLWAYASFQFAIVILFAHIFYIYNMVYSVL
nr:unnamed protein product [Digitaria exilis]